MLLFPEILNKMSGRELTVRCKGCDVSGKMINICEGKGLEVIKGDFLAVSSEFKTAHLIWSNMVLIHLRIKKIQEYLDKMSLLHK